ncbi:hypothetical protein [Pseudonocardia acidicola]|uniref:Uncharacterized protein n=1 Tax=Pseudonocardia acidicola TaxID=2724939 RepID=A0ABX1SJ22_9PSEU|nr:hypothetical protein [Pseudonocardia acidicola]NMI01590.1 hypothetical protein [Pseudonocardia acidicola]
MNWTIGLGLVVLVVLSVGLGKILAGERIEGQRKRLAAKQWDLWLWEQELLNIAEFRGCPSCQLLRRRADLQRSAPEV